MADLYLQEVRAFKPTPINATPVAEFVMPKTPAVPEPELSVLSLDAYAAADVETASAALGSAAAEEDWFVFEEDTHGH